MPALLLQARRPQRLVVIEKTPDTPALAIPVVAEDPQGSVNRPRRLKAFTIRSETSTFCDTLYTRSCARRSAAARASSMSVYVVLRTINPSLH